MRKTLIAALVIAGAASQVMAQSAKEATLNFSLTHQYQKDIKVNGQIPPLNEVNNVYMSWPSIVACDGVVTYKSMSKKVTSQSLIQAISFAFTQRTSLFTSKAQLVVIRYTNPWALAPYPTLPGYMPYEESDVNLDGVQDANWTIPTMSADGQATWPDENIIRWDLIQPSCAADAERTVNWTHVYIKDPNNPVAIYRCVQVTPFFAFEESYCQFCWDTIDRVTDGSIVAGEIGGEPCLEGPACNLKGSGTTKWFMTARFNNTVMNSHLLKDYWNLLYTTTLADGGAYGFVAFEPLPVAPGQDNVDKALWITVSGVATYKWSYKSAGKGLGVASIGTISVSNAQGYGMSPFCGVVTGSFSIPEKFISQDVCPGVYPAFPDLAAE